MTPTIRPVLTFTIRPALPESLSGLRDLAYNLWWSWNFRAQDLFRRIDGDAWRSTMHNPVAMLSAVEREQLQARASDAAIVNELARVREEFDHYMHGRTWFELERAAHSAMCVAYFSMEYGLTESVPLYSGGLGVLSGDHLKAASDLGVPVVGVGMLYRQGYFRQWIDPAGQQRERYPENDFSGQPIHPQTNASGEPIVVRIPISGRDVAVRVWRLDVGRVPLVLLDANLPENSPEDRDLTAKLYQGDSDVRIRQEMLLGIGGVRALHAVGFVPTVAHMNEGHSAFLILERVREARATFGWSLEAALTYVSASTVFTTHTPVPAGHDTFSPEQIERHMGGYLADAGVTPEDLVRRGRVRPEDSTEPFGMTPLALRGAWWRNGVAELHGQVSRSMWQGIWPEAPSHEVPIGHVTNGVHMRTWASRELAELFDRYIGAEWSVLTDDAAIAEGIDAIPDDEFWRVHVRRRERLVTSARRRIRQQVERRWGSPEELGEADAVLRPDVLTVGFARRIAVYKRPTLLLHDMERLRALLRDEARPVQFVFAGKAHPKDQMAKDLLRQLTALEHDDTCRGRLIFIEDYDMAIARDLVQGCDVWLNTPIRPHEASGTSGMKAAANGGLNVSVLDGWWAEAYEPEVGWAIGRGETEEHDGARDASEAAALYDLLERSVAPLFYAAVRADVPDDWVKKSKAAMAMAVTRFSTNRMVRDYTGKFYGPAHELGERLRSNRGAGATALAEWQTRMHNAWPNVRIVEVHGDGAADQDVGAAVDVRARIARGGLTPAELSVQVYRGRVDQDGSVADGSAIRAEPADAGTDGTHWFRARVDFQRSGLVGLALRVMPSHSDLANAFELGLVRWSSVDGHA